MNRLRTHKFKPSAHLDLATNTNNNNTLESDTPPATGLLNKISKRYSTLSNRISRRHNVARKSHSPPKAFSGSYDMTGSNSEDHRLEIGAPVLISTTTLDTDRFDVSADRLKQIGGGVAATNNVVRLVCATSSPHSKTATMTSSGSETEVYVDALCSTPMAEHCGDRDKTTRKVDIDDEEEEFEMALSTPKSDKFVTKTIDLKGEAENLEGISKKKNVDSIDSDEPTGNPLSNYYEIERVIEVKPKLRKKQSKSAVNLHRSEMKVFLQKAPSMELKGSLSVAGQDDDEQSRIDLPKLPELFGASKCSLAPTDNEDADEVDKENALPSCVTNQLNKSDPTNAVSGDYLSGYLSQQQQFKSVDSLDIHRNAKLRIVNGTTTNIFNSDSSFEKLGSKNSLNSHNSTIADFDLKSASCQSLNAQNLFVSIEELNEITRQINESEEFNREIDLEYCMHRDNLKPSERRITLLKNKNSRMISFNNNKEKLKKGWSGVKHWIGEESSKFKEAVQKQATLQRANVSKLNLNQSECRDSPSVHGSVLLAGSRMEMRDLSITDSEANTTGSSYNLHRRLSLAPDMDMSLTCDQVDGDSRTNVEDVELSPTEKAPVDERIETSPAAKRFRREGQNGFEELRRYIKQGGDFGKELILILQERVESELLYSKSLSKMANKLNKACRELPGSIADAWRGVATEMENRSDIHRQLSASLTEEIVKPLKTIVDSQHKTRKTVESNVDKASRVLAEWRVSEAKSKKSSHTAARENEKLQDAMLDVRIQKSPSIAMLHQGPNKVAAEKEIKSAEKDCAKLDNKRKKAEEAVKRADVEYYTLCVRAERARVDWEMSVLRGSSVLQNIENQRLANMKNFVANYSRLTANMNPIVDGLVQRLKPQIDACNVVKDLQVVKNIRRNAEGPSEQLLPDFYCEHTTLAMNRERRKHSLVKLLQLVKADLERERRSRNGLKGLSQSLNNQENQNITDKLYHIRSMLTYLEGARFKLHSALLELDHKPRTSHPLAQHIQITRDRTGLQQSILKVPVWLKNNDKMNTSSSEDNEYDTISQTNTNSSNVSCLDLSKDQGSPIKKFNRSKSNIENYSVNSQIGISTTTTTTATSTVNPAKSKVSDLYSDRGQADGGSNQQDSDFDEFSSQDEDDDDEPVSGGRREHKAIIEKSKLLAANCKIQHNDSVDHDYQNSDEVKEEQQQEQINTYVQATLNSSDSNRCSTMILGRCKALYSYTPKLYDELELNPGDIIEVHAKQEDGWWLGALRNQVGIFPATYVEEIA